MRRRRRRGVIVKFGLLAALMVAVAALVTLIITILNSSFGLVAVENVRSPSELVASLGYPKDAELGDLTKQELVLLLGQEISTNLGRRFEREQRFFDDRLVFEDKYLLNDLCMSDDPPSACWLPARSHDDVEALVVERVVEPTIVGTWSFLDSTFDPGRDRGEGGRGLSGGGTDLPVLVVLGLRPEPPIAGSGHCGDPDGAARFALGGPDNPAVLLPDRGRGSHLPGGIRQGEPSERHRPDQHQQPGRCPVHHLRNARSGYLRPDDRDVHQRIVPGGRRGGDRRRPHHSLGRY